MKLFKATIESYRSQAGDLLCEGYEGEIAEFVSSVGDGYSLGKFIESDKEENGGAWGGPPDNWTPEAPFYVKTPTEVVGGFKTLRDALVGYADEDERVKLYD